MTDKWYDPQRRMTLVGQRCPATTEYGERCHAPAHHPGGIHRHTSRADGSSYTWMDDVAAMPAADRHVDTINPDDWFSDLQTGGFFVSFSDDRFWRGFWLGVIAASVFIFLGTLAWTLLA